MAEERRYPASREYLLNIVCDIIEMHNGKNVTSDTHGGKIGFTVRMYGMRRRYEFEVVGEGEGCLVRLSTDGGGSAEARQRQMFALMESMMGDRLLS